MNIGEIAKRAGVSRSTVSYAISGKRSVSEPTRRRIQQVIDQLEYQPNAAARALKEGRTRTLGLVVPPTARRLTYVQQDIVAGVLDAAARADLDILLSPAGADQDRSFDRMVDGRRVDGIILMDVRLDDSRVARLERTRMPYVTIGRTAHPEGTAWVDVDYITLINRCVHHLADLGHRQIALINHSADLLAAGDGPGHRARQGFRDAVGRYGVGGVEYSCMDDASAGDACMTEILQLHPEVTAAVTVDEAALIGFQRALQRGGLRVPADFSIIAIAARPWAEEFQPQLTAADVPTGELGAGAVELLTARIADPSGAARHLLLAPPISLRDSTGRAPATARG
jgi:DNA-binding LacI/PurR family transcriptional regulator